MALPLRFEPRPRDAREQLRERIEKAPTEHAEALLSGYDVLQGLHEKGILDLLKGALSEGGTLIDTAVEVIKTPEAIRSIRNLLLLNKLLGELDPDLLGAVVQATTKSLAEVSAAKEPPGLLSLLRRFSSADSRRAMGVGSALLESLGKNLKSGQ
jgi:uncharacterized protein YjgD (DUF1641 family)